jgi:hypothetical protein
MKRKENHNVEVYCYIAQEYIEAIFYFIKAWEWHILNCKKKIHSAMKLQRTIFLVRHQISSGIVGTKLTMRKKTNNKRMNINQHIVRSSYLTYLIFQKDRFSLCNCSIHIRDHDTIIPFPQIYLSINLLIKSNVKHKK